MILLYPILYVVQSGKLAHLEWLKISEKNMTPLMVFKQYKHFNSQVLCKNCVVWDKKVKEGDFRSKFKLTESYWFAVSGPWAGKVVKDFKEKNELKHRIFPFYYATLQVFLEAFFVQ